MIARKVASVLAASFLSMQYVPGPALARNQMGYELLSSQQAAQLPHRGGALGVDVGSGQQIASGGMNFELLLVKGVRRNSPGAEAGFRAGDQIIAVDGLVFQSIATFAAYIVSRPEGQQITVDYIPSGGGPQQAQRVGVTLGTSGNGVSAAPNQQDRRAGLSKGTKLAIGAAAAALFGCYELGCFSHPKAGAGAASQ